MLELLLGIELELCTTDELLSTAAELELGITVNVPQLAILLLPPQLAIADTLYTEAAGLLQFGALVQAMPDVTVVTPHLTAGCTIATPETPLAGIPMQESSSAEGAALTVNIPLQSAVLPLHSPEPAATDMPIYVPAAGSSQLGTLGVPLQ